MVQRHGNFLAKIMVIRPHDWRTKMKRRNWIAYYLDMVWNFRDAFIPPDLFL